MNLLRCAIALLPMLAAFSLPCLGAPEVDKEPEVNLSVPPEKAEAPLEQPKPEVRVADEEPEIDRNDDCGLDALITKESVAMEREDVPIRAGFAAKFQDEVNPFTLMTTTVMPGETLDVEALLTTAGSTFEATATGGNLEKLAPDRWRWRAPKEKGCYCVKIREVETGSTMCINTFVLVPYKGEEVLNGYKIGRYEKLPRNDDPAYNRPNGFIEITRENENEWVSPHFQLRQFASKQAGGYPKYLILRPRLLLKLEMLLAEMKDKGVPADSFYVVSAYRTPFYNASIGNKTTYSRHSYGDAADIFVDQDRNGTIDDLNKDGKQNDDDVRVMLNFVKKAREETWFKPFVGGLGFYAGNPSRCGFIHVDTRGKPVNW